MNRKRTEQWLKRYNDVINYNAIEREAGITNGSLQKFVKYNRPLSDLKLIAVTKTLKKAFRK